MNERSPKLNKILDSYWIENATGTVGLVLVENRNFGKVAYIGVSEDKDEKEILNFGTEVPVEVLPHCFPELKKDIRFQIKHQLRTLLSENLWLFLLGVSFGSVLTFIIIL